MRQILKFIVTTFVTLCYCTTLSAQVDSSVVLETRVYAKYLDSINRLDHPQNFGFMTSIADGIIKRDDAIIGGFGVYTLSNSKGDTALRIEYHDNVDINIYKTYYYKSDKLIYATLELRDYRDNMKRIYHKEEFYNGDSIICTTNEKAKKANRYIDKTNFSLYEDGLKFLKDFKIDYNRR